MKYRQAIYSHSDTLNEPLLIELSQEGRSSEKNEVQLPEELKRKTEPALPELSELTVVRHYTRLSQMNFGVDTGTYPLGSCTMKYNPKINDAIASLPGFAFLHPAQKHSTVQGALEVIWRLQNALIELTGMDAISVQPAAGSQGEFTGMLITKRHFEELGETRTKVLIPDTAHGSNFASAAMAGFEVVSVPTKQGEIDTQRLSELLDERVAAFMVTVPNTLGLFETKILEISSMVHSVGALMYFDGANMNALLGVTKPGELGFDIAHLNLHKTFSTPHGGGGPGAGPVLVKRFLEPYLPVPRLKRRENGELYWEYDYPKSIGRVREGFGNFAVLVRAYAYIRALGLKGLTQVSKDAVLVSNYAAKRLSTRYLLPYPEKKRKHEFVISSKGTGKRALEIAKHILSRGHAPTIYFPQIVDEALMIEFTESETKSEVDSYIEGLLEALERDLSNEPSATSVARLDEVKAAREPILNWREMLKNG
jgi:Glycine cleavage system protein P (pyridoxal-binding), C-terminal domain